MFLRGDEFNRRESDKVSEAARANLEFFVKLRNKVEHKHLEKSDLESLIFGECQALLYNFEDLAIRLFGSEYSLHENLVFSLQFSRMRTTGQTKANRTALSKDLIDVRDFVAKYRNNLDDPVFQSQEYSIKLLQIPRVSNTGKMETAIEFVRWDDLSKEDRRKVDHLVTLIKDKRVQVEGANVDRLKPGQVCDRVKKATKVNLSASYHHRLLTRIFGVRPPSGCDDPFETNTKYCHYDEPHEDYVYQKAWVDFIVNLIEHHAWTKELIREKDAEGSILDPSDFGG